MDIFDINSEWNKAIECVKKICSPLFKETGLHYFHYIKVFSSGEALILSTDYRPIQYCVEQRLCPTLEYWDNNDSRKIIWNSELFSICAFEPLRNNKLHKDLWELFNIDYVLNFVQKNTDNYEFYGFATFKNNQDIMELYLCYLQKLNEFRYYFKEQASALIRKFEKLHLYLLLFEQKAAVSKKLKQIFQDNEQQLLIGIKPKKYYLHGDNEGIYLTKREVDCLRLLVKNKTAKEIANELMISFYTVEKHLLSARKKLNSLNRSHLVKNFTKLCL